jgi:DNA-binding transcriptional regulator YiaG
MYTVINWEKGRTEPPTTAYAAILAFLGYDPRQPATTLGEHLRARRGALGLSIRAAAAAVGADPTAFGNWERGGIVLHRKHRQRLAGFLGIDPQEIDERMRLLWKEAHAPA